MVRGKHIALVFTPVLAPVLAIVLAGACGGSPSSDGMVGARPSSVSVRLVPVHEEPLDLTYRAAGTVHGRARAVLAAKVTGYLRAVKVRPGDEVRAGQLLALIESKGLSASLLRAAAGREGARHAQVEAGHALRAAEVALRLAETENKRADALLAAQAVSAQAADEVGAKLQGAQAAKQMAEERLQAAQSREAEAEAERGLAEVVLGDARLIAPFAGQVVERFLDAGNLATPGTPLFVVETRGEVRVEVTVEESLLAMIHAGDKALVDVDVDVEPTGRSREGTVTEIVPLIDAASQASVVKVTLDKTTSDLRPGMFARVAFRVGMRPRLVIPAGAVSRQGALERVFVADGDHLRLRMITCGESHGPWTEVLSGLKAGERVVAAARADVVDGAGFVDGAALVEGAGLPGNGRR